MKTRDVLTRAEILVLKNSLHGRTSREIGRSLSISPRTVEAHRRMISKKLRMKSGLIPGLLLLAFREIGASRFLKIAVVRARR